ncbi:MAG: hypothetical protein MHM6MM_001373 [Cercozoa sp. M6MM]
MGVLAQYNALVRKNFLMLSRRKKAAFFEMLLPILFFVLIWWLRSVIEKTPQDLSLHLDALQDISTCTDTAETLRRYGDIYSSSCRIGLLDVARRYVGLDFTCDSDDPCLVPPQMHLAVVPDTGIGADFAAYYKNHMNDSLTTAINNRPFSAKELEELRQLTQERVMFFKNEDKLEDYIRDGSYSYPEKGFPPVYAAVVFNKADGPKFEISIRLNATGADDVPLTKWDELRLVDKGFDDEHYTTYLQGGFIHLQMITSAFIESRVKGTMVGPADTAVSFVPFATPEFVKDDFASVMDYFTLIFVLCFVYPVLRTTKELVEEKETRIREHMATMGLSTTVYFMSWFTVYVAKAIVPVTIITLMTSVDVFEFSSPGLIWFYLFSFYIAVFSFCWAVSCFFTRAKLASFMAVILFVGLYFPYFSVMAPDVSEGGKRGASLLTPVAFSLGISTIFRLEIANSGLNSSTINFSLYGYEVGTAIGFFFLNFFLYSIVSSYLGAILPSKYGTRLPWHFPFSPSYWRGGPIRPISFRRLFRRNAVGSHDVELQLVDSDIQAFPAHPRDESKFQQKDNGSPSVVLDRLTKEFPLPGSDAVFRAVDGICLNMYEDQILSLLGHNGAGKSTTINVLTGMYGSTGGRVTMHGMDLESDRNRIRQMIGICPQHDVLWGPLTVREHLRLYARIKGVPSNEVGSAVEEIITEVGLDEKANSQSASLSGGQKRKLSVAIAFIGNSKIVFLDEPSSGMDTYSRRFLWELLKRKKQGRTIVLTTHFMEEADQLGDNIAIMAHGRVQCYGTSLFLKSNYGVGYSLTVSRPSEGADKTEEIKRCVLKHVPEASVLSDSAGEFSFRLPLECSAQFPDLFDELDARQAELNFESYGVSVTTLEEVFLRVGHAQTPPEEEQKLERRASSLTTKDFVIDEDDHARHQQLAEQARSLLADVPKYPADSGVQWRHFRAMFAKRVNNMKRDKRAWVWTAIVPGLITFLGLQMTKSSVGDHPAASFAFRDNAMNDPLPTPYAARDGVSGTLPNFLSSVMMPTKTVEMQDILPATNATLVDVQNELLRTGTIEGEYANKETRYGTFYHDASVTNASSVNGGETFVLFNTTARDSLPAFLNEHFNQRLRAEVDPEFEVDILQHPLPKTEGFKALQSSMAPLLIAIGFSFIPAGFAYFIVHERATKAKHQQMISGAKTFAYWASAYAWDLVNSIVPALLCILFILMFNIETLVGEALPAVLLIVLLYAVSVTPFTYLFSFLFSDATAAQNMTLFMNIAFALPVLLASIILQFFDSTKSASDAITWISYFVPIFSLGKGIHSLTLRDAALIWEGDTKGVWDMEITGRPLLFLALTAPVYFGLVLLVEYLRTRSDVLRRFHREPTVVEKPFRGDDNVSKEVERVDTILQGDKIPDDDVIVVNHLRKAFHGRAGAPSKLAVRDLAFGVKRGECFGFLGVNGAGKTTALSMMTGDLLPSSGTVMIDGIDLATDAASVRSRLGYCPQFDALVETLTGREVLTMYARLRHVREEAVADFVDGMVNLVGLNFDGMADRPCGSYSGGNKRKLSVAVALAGNPSVIYLDEPTTGVDPGARRQMWDLIAATMKDRAVILTTHSMDECVALCQRISIMVSGQLRACGTFLQLKDDYGQGYQVDINLDEDEDAPFERLSEFMKSNFSAEDGTAPGLIERHGAMSKWQVSSDFSIGQIFRVLEASRQELRIQDYSASETTLEQIFNNFAKQELEEAEYQQALAAVH